MAFNYIAQLSLHFVVASRAATKKLFLIEQRENDNHDVNQYAKLHKTKCDLLNECNA